MENIIKVIPIKKEGVTIGIKKYSVFYKVWICNLEITKNDGSIKILKGSEFMKSKKLKRDAIEEANKYKEYLLSRGDFYFV
jgi:hypothetical protein